MQTKYIHLRQVKYTTGLQARGGLTIAFREIPLANGNKSVSIATARCSRNDVFNKKIGRNVAEGRLNTIRNGSQLVTVTLPEDADTVDQLVAAYSKKGLQLI